MRNSELVLKKSIELMNLGILKSSGRTITVEHEDGSKEVMPEPEPIHTYAVWKDLGYQVTKGQKAIAAIRIWKHTDAGIKKDKNSGEDIEVNEKMFMKVAYFFKFDQVEPIAKTD